VIWTTRTFRSNNTYNMNNWRSRCQAGWQWITGWHWLFSAWPRAGFVSYNQLIVRSHFFCMLTDPTTLNSSTIVVNNIQKITMIKYATHHIQSIQNLWKADIEIWRRWHELYPKAWTMSTQPADSDENDSHGQIILILTSSWTVMQKSNIWDAEQSQWLSWYYNERASCLRELRTHRLTIQRSQPLSPIRLVQGHLPLAN
jgi:hypothetical protein